MSVTDKIIILFAGLALLYFAIATNLKKEVEYLPGEIINVCISEELNN